MYELYIIINYSLSLSLSLSLHDRHVILPKEIARLIPKNKLMAESEWRGYGVQQSQGWVHYLIHTPGMQVTYN